MPARHQEVLVGRQLDAESLPEGMLEASQNAVSI